MAETNLKDPASLNDLTRECCAASDSSDLREEQMITPKSGLSGAPVMEATQCSA